MNENRSEILVAAKKALSVLVRGFGEEVVKANFSDLLNAVLVAAAEDEPAPAPLYSSNKIGFLASLA